MHLPRTEEEPSLNQTTEWGNLRHKCVANDGATESLIDWEELPNPNS